MDWNWTSCFGGFWMFALFALLFVALMALACFAKTRSNSEKPCSPSCS